MSDELRDALAAGSFVEIPHGTDLKKLKVIYRAATKYAALMPLLEELVEARSHIYSGEWELGCHPANPRLHIIKPITMRDNMGKLPECEGSHAFFKKKDVAQFITKAANLTTQIKEITEKD